MNLSDFTKVNEVSDTFLSHGWMSKLCQRRITHSASSSKSFLPDETHSSVHSTNVRCQNSWWHNNHWFLWDHFLTQQHQSWMSTTNGISFILFVLEYQLTFLQKGVFRDFEKSHESHAWEWKIYLHRLGRILGLSKAAQQSQEKK